MSIGWERTPDVVTRAIEFLADPKADGRAYMAEHDGNPEHAIHYTLGQAQSLIQQLLDLAGYPELAPNASTLWRMEWEAKWNAEHPLEDDELDEVSAW